jgi:hypothetical protein
MVFVEHAQGIFDFGFGAVAAENFTYFRAREAFFAAAQAPQDRINYDVTERISEDVTRGIITVAPYSQRSAQVGLCNDPRAVQ